MIGAGIVDPDQGHPFRAARTPRPSAAMVLTTEALVADKPEASRTRGSRRHGRHGRHVLRDTAKQPQ